MKHDISILSHFLFISLETNIAMAGVKILVAYAFVAAIGLTFFILSCTLPFGDTKPNPNQWCNFATIIFYILTPLPILIWKRSGQSSLRDGCIFFTTGFVVSGFALPIVLARAKVVSENEHIVKIDY